MIEKFHNQSPDSVGLGVGLRPCHYDYVLTEKPPISFFEVISENFMIDGGRPLDILDRVRKDYPIALHGVSMSLGSKDDISSDYLNRLKALIERVDPLWVSDHLCWTGVSAHNAHDLWPLPYTKETIEWVVQKIDKVQNFLGRQIAIENVSTYIEYPHSEISEHEFLTEIANKADCGILFDINNIFVSCHNHKLNPYEYIDAIPTSRIWEIHLAGPSERGEYFVDTHDHPVKPQVWEMYKYFIEKAGPLPTLLEWDEKIPEFPVLLEEVMKAKRIIDGIQS